MVTHPRSYLSNVSGMVKPLCFNVTIGKKNLLLGSRGVSYIYIL